MSATLESILASLQGDERAIAEEVLRRLADGRQKYGAWVADDGRDLPAEALAEVIDALHDAAAELVRLRRWRTPDSGRPRRVYVCCALSDASVGCVCSDLLDGGAIPVAPQLFIKQVVGASADREPALAIRLALVDACEELQVHGDRVTYEMRLEIGYAEARGIPVTRVEEEVG